MYEHYKNQVISNLISHNITLKEDEINKILLSMDQAASNFNFYEKASLDNFELCSNGVPAIIYNYLDVKQAEGLAKETIYCYKISLEHFFIKCNKHIKEITADDVRRYLTNYQNEHNVCNRTLDKYREYILRFFNWCHQLGYIDKNIAVQCKPIQYENTQRVSLTEYELELFRQACKTSREKAIVETFYSTACRVSELAIIKLSDINWDTGEVHIFGKGQKHRTSFINARARVAIENYIKLERQGDSDYLFTSNRKPFNHLSKAAIEKIIREIDERAIAIHKKVTPHILRHTTATLALHNGMDINEISKLLGHDSIETTMIYAKTSYDSVRQSHAKYI